MKIGGEKTLKWQFGFSNFDFYQAILCFPSTFWSFLPQSKDQNLNCHFYSGFIFTLIGKKMNLFKNCKFFIQLMTGLIDMKIFSFL